MAKRIDGFKPGIILNESHFHLLGAEGVFADAVERVASEGFFRHAELAHIDGAAERRRIGRIIESSGLSLIQWMNPLLISEKLNLSDRRESERSKAVGAIKQRLEEAAECGASALGLASGPDPGPEFRPAATEQLFRSLCELCEAARSYPGMRILLEPLDRDAHKNYLIGPTGEFVTLAGRVAAEHANFGLCWDTSHVALCGDDLFQSLSASRRHVLQIHLANAVLDRGEPGFGDHHMPVGTPGFLTIEEIAGLFARAAGIGLFDAGELPVAVETRSAEGADPWATVAGCQKVLREAWRLFQSEIVGDEGS